jgi:hypothetical protein
VRRHQLLRGIHELLQPRSYFEIGVSTGISMRLSRTKSVGVDPFFTIEKELLCDLHLVRSSSDEFFTRKHPFAHFDEPVIDLAFIDGMHLAEYALRDVINTERHTRSTSVIVIDDMLPRDVPEASRDRITRAWAGDVYKMIGAFQAHRPDLVCLQVNTTPTGTAVLLLPDPSSTALADEYDRLVEELVVPDPQVVPEAILERAHSIEPEHLLEAPIWEGLRRLRSSPDAVARPQVRALLEQAGLTGPQGTRAQDGRDTRRATPASALR